MGEPAAALSSAGEALRSRAAVLRELPHVLPPAEEVVGGFRRALYRGVDVAFQVVRELCKSVDVMGE